MNVTKDNFAAVVDEFCELASTCDFFAFDEEMTGINLSGMVETPIMTVSERYCAKKQVAERYSIIQVGVCLFHKVDSGSNKLPRYVARPFNFFLFPSPMVDEGTNASSTAATDATTASLASQDVVLSSSAIAFLRRHGMNFQRWVYDGVPFCNEAQDIIIRKQFNEAESLIQANASGPKLGSHFLSAEDNVWVEAAMKAASEFSKATSPNEMMMPPTKSRAARELFRHSAEREFPNVLVAFRGRYPSKDAVLLRTSAEERDKKALVDKQLRERALLDKIGFRKVFLALTESQKPCVGHNAFADVLFLLSALDKPLPPTVSEFRKRLGDVLPCVFDTKFISQDLERFPKERFANTHLGGLYESYKEAPRVSLQLPLGFEAYSDQTLVKSKSSGKGAAAVAHEAGFDAMMTGFVLLNLLEEAKLDLNSARQLYGNKIALFRSLYAFDGGATLDDADASFYLPRGPVLFASHPPEVTAADIQALVGGVVGAVCAENVGQGESPARVDPDDLTVMSVDSSSTVVVPFQTQHFDEAKAARMVAALNKKTIESPALVAVEFSLWKQQQRAVVPQSSAPVTAAGCVAGALKGMKSAVAGVAKAL